MHRNIYEFSLLRKIRLGKPVIGVGNLSFGGSGKTIVAMAIARKLAADGKRVGIVCRSHAAEAGPHLLSEGNADPYVVGDEAAMVYAAAVAGGESCARAADSRIVIVSGHDKTAAARALLESDRGVDAIVVDDAFQHHKLHQDARILIWPKPDATLRDFRGASSRAQVLLVPNGYRSPLPDEETIYFVKEIDPQSVRAAGANVLLVAGLGPESDFFWHARKNMTEGVDARELRLPDHADYRDAGAQARVADAARGRGAILTTAKDAVKLARLAIPLPPIYVVKVGVRFLTNEHLLWQAVGRAI